MKTPEEILLDVWEKTGVEKGWDTIAIEAMKEFGRQAWIKCASGFERSGPDCAESFLYDRYLQDLYLNQIAKDSQERGEYEAKPEKCEHKNSFFFHVMSENRPNKPCAWQQYGLKYCPDCKKYIDGENEI